VQSVLYTISKHRTLPSAKNERSSAEHPGRGGITWGEREDNDIREAGVLTDNRTLGGVVRTGWLHGGTEKPVFTLPGCMDGT
jgi:hypothetical protein